MRAYINIGTRIHGFDEDLKPSKHSSSSSSSRSPSISLSSPASAPSSPPAPAEEKQNEGHGTPADANEAGEGGADADRGSEGNGDGSTSFIHRPFDSPASLSLQNSAPPSSPPSPPRPTASSSGDVASEIQVPVGAVAAPVDASVGGRAEGDKGTSAEDQELLQQVDQFIAPGCGRWRTLRTHGSLSSRRSPTAMVMVCQVLLVA